MNLRRCARPSVAVLGASLAWPTFAGSASAAILYQETFDDAVLQPGTNFDEGEISDGVFKGIDALTTDKTVFNVAQNFTSPVMTFSFDVVAPVVPTGPLVDKSNPLDGIPDVHETELLFRTANDTGTDTPSSSQDVNELVLHRDDGNRGGYLNNGNESIFVIVNNSAGLLNFASPVDGSNVALDNQQSVSFIRNNVDGTYVRAQAPTAWQQAGPITRFAIGSGSNADQDTFSIDNVGVVDEVSFQGIVVPEPSALALLGAGGLLALRRRRRLA